MSNKESVHMCVSNKVFVHMCVSNKVFVHMCVSNKVFVHMCVYMYCMVSVFKASTDFPTWTQPYEGDIV